jgi:hypothetical protein
MMTPTDPGKLRDLVGASAPVAYRELMIRYAGLATVKVCHYATPPMLQERIEITELEQQIIDQAMTIRSDAQIPFWEALFAACLRSGQHPDSLLDAAGFHNGPGKLITVSADAIKEGRLSEMASEGQRNVGITSALTFTNSEVHHLPLMDFHCDLSQTNTEIVASVCRRIMPQGFLLLDSGDSYHACGVALMSATERIEFLGRSLFFAPIVDSAYVAHQLLQPMSSIRISTGGSRHKCPEVLVVELASS